MSGPFGKLIAQLVVSGASIFSRAFVAAYSQAVQNAKTGTQESVKAMARTSKMSTAEALQVLNLSKTEMEPIKITQQYTRYFESNEPSKGGSFYLQSKVWRAREALQETLELQAKEAQRQREEAEAVAKAQAAAAGGERPDADAAGKGPDEGTKG